MGSEGNTFFTSSDNADYLQTARSSLAIPTELLDSIVDFILACRLAPTSGQPVDKFASIASFSLASTRLRQIALRRYFCVLHLTSSAHWIRLRKVLISQGEQAFAWVRSIHGYAETFSSTPALLNTLPNLKIIAIDFTHAGVATQQTLLKKICKPPQASTSNPPSPMNYSPNHSRTKIPLFRVTSLTLTSLPYIDKGLLTFIAKNFSTLTCLYLSCTDRLDLRCCWGCFQESASCTIGISPIPDMFADVGYLADTFAAALKPLSKLTHLHLGIFLSDENLFYTHLDHVADENFWDYSIDEEDSPYGPDTCRTCLTTGPVDVVRKRELEASKIMARRLKTLESIGWSTFFKTGQDSQEESLGKVGDWERRTTRWVLRKDGKLFIRKRPW